MARPITKLLRGRALDPRVGSWMVVILYATLLAAGAQTRPEGGGAFVGLPPASTLIGPLRGLPDGRVVAMPESARPPPDPPARASPRPRAPTPESIGAKSAVAVGTPAAPLAARSVEPATPTVQMSPPHAPVQGPRGTIVSQIHNAPGWQPSHIYRYATGPYTRVVNGSGWTPATADGGGILPSILSAVTGSLAKRGLDDRFHPGRMLRAYQLTSAGTCTSGSSGGPTGTGAMIKDGTCVWKYLSRVDYISITGWAFDNRRWKSGTFYHFLDYVTSGSPLRAYSLQNDSCVSTVAPTGIGNKSVIETSDGCRWRYDADIIYTSRRSYILTETFTSRRSAATLRMKANYEAQLWNDREYVAGQNGEAAPIRTQNHNDYRHEGGVIHGCAKMPCYHIIITTAAGESFRDSLRRSDPLTGYDPSKGVAIRNSLPYRWPFQPAGIDVHDNYVDLIGLQIKSMHSAAVNGMSSFGNRMIILDCILDGGSDDRRTSHAAVTTDTSSVVANSLVIARGPIGIDFKYPGYALHDTIVNPNHVANSVGITTWHNWVFKGQTVSDTAIFGFAHAAASTAKITSRGPAVTWLGGHNVTDAPKGDFGKNTPGGTVYVLPGTTYGASASAALAAPGTDWRAKASGPLAGMGDAYGTFGLYCPTGGYRPKPNCPQRVNYNFDRRDILGTPRPQRGHYDIGAWQTPSTRTAVGAAGH